MAQDTSDDVSWPFVCFFVFISIFSLLTTLLRLYLTLSKKIGDAEAVDNEQGARHCPGHVRRRVLPVAICMFFCLHSNFITTNYFFIDST